MNTLVSRHVDNWVYEHAWLKGDGKLKYVYQYLHGKHSCLFSWEKLLLFLKNSSEKFEMKESAWLVEK